MNFLVNSGSIVFPIYILMFIVFLVSKLIHLCAVGFFKYKPCRIVGIYVHEKQKDFGNETIKLIIESFFELSLSASLYSKQQMMFTTDWRNRFFGSPSDITASILAYIAMLLCVIFSLIPIFIMCRYKGRTERNIKMNENLIFFEDLKSSGNCGYFQAQFMLIRLLTALVLVFLKDWPIF